MILLFLLRPVIVQYNRYNIRNHINNKKLIPLFSPTRVIMLIKAIQYLAFSVLIGLIQVYPAKAQIETLIEQGSEYLPEMASKPSFLGMAHDHRYEGTPYSPADWHNGRIYFNNGKKSPTLKLRYNAYQNELEFRQNDQVMALLPKLFKGFVLYRVGRSPLIFQKGFRSDKFNISKNQLLQTFNTGLVRLLKHHDILYHEGMVKEMRSGLYVDEFIQKPQYYIVRIDNQLVKVKLKRKNILDVLQNRSSELKTYASRNDLSFRDEAEVAQIINHYNKLVAAN